MILLPFKICDLSKISPRIVLFLLFLKISLPKKKIPAPPIKSVILGDSPEVYKLGVEFYGVDSD